MTASSTAAHRATEAAKETREAVSEIARDVSRKAGRQFARAKNMATDAYEEAHEASREYPHVTLASDSYLACSPPAADGNCAGTVADPGIRRCRGEAVRYRDSRRTRV
jgi:hypothetical protein